MTVDKLPQFSVVAKATLADGLREAARDTLIKARRTAPFKHGGLRSNSDHHAITPLYQRVSFWIEYARFQEFGGDSNRRVRNYTTSGTGAHYLKDAGDAQVKRLPLILAKHGRRARV